MNLEPAKKKKIGSAGTFGLVAILTVFSKIIGFIRDMVVAAAYGTTVIADAYNYAYLFTGNILILFGGLGGPFHSAIVTTLTPRKDNPQSGVLITQTILSTFFILTIFAVILWLAAPYLAFIGDSSHHATNQQRFIDEAIMQIRIMSPLVVIAGLIGISYGVLNVYNRIFWPSLSPVLASLAIIAVLAICPNRESTWPLAIGTLIGAILQLSAQIPEMYRCNLKYGISNHLAPEVKSYISMLWPAILGTSIGQLTIYVDYYFSKAISEGAWTAICTANRLIQLPLGVLITAMLVPVLPRFTEQATANRYEDLKDEFRRALRFLWFLSVPITVVLLVIPNAIIQLLFQRGAFNEKSTDLVTTALVFFVPSIIFYIGRDLITRVFYAVQAPKIPYYIAMVAILLKAILDWLFVNVIHLGVGGISLATTLVTMFNLIMLSFLLRYKIGSLGFSKLIKPVLIMSGAGIAASITASYSRLLVDNLPKQLHWGNMLLTIFSSRNQLTHSFVHLLLIIAIPSIVAVVTYIGVCALLQLDELRYLYERFSGFLHSHFSAFRRSSPRS